MTEYICYQFWQSYSGAVKFNAALFQQIKIGINNGVLNCDEKCPMCPFEGGKIDLHCQGVRPDGDTRFCFTVRNASRDGDGTITCNLLPNENPCHTCLLDFRKKGC